MCVILIGAANKVLQHVEDAMDANPHGSGVAWLDKHKGRRVVRYLKGIYAQDEAESLVRSLNGRQIVFHARIATAGGAIPSLTHPFPVEINPDLSLEGKTDMVLFHNGHVWKWEDLRGGRYDGLAWSDSRAVAHGFAIGTVSNFGDARLSGSKYVVFSPDYLGYTPKKSWSHVKGGVLASNRDFLFDWTRYERQQEDEYWNALKKSYERRTELYEQRWGREWDLNSAYEYDAWDDRYERKSLGTLYAKGKDSVWREHRDPIVCSPDPDNPYCD